MNQVLCLSLTINMMFAQSAVVRDSWFGIDKIKHFFLSAFITSVSFGSLQAVGANRSTALTGAIGVTAGAGLARELYNRRTTGIFSVRDLTWDAAGIGAASVMLSKTGK